MNEHLTSIFFVCSTICLEVSYKHIDQVKIFPNMFGFISGSRERVHWERMG